MSALLNVRSVSYKYPGHPVLDSVEFSAQGGNVKFMIDEAGAVPYAILQAVEGDIKAYRK